MHPLLQQVERTEGFERDDEFCATGSEEAGDGGECKEESRGVEHESGFLDWFFHRRLSRFSLVTLTLSLGLPLRPSSPPRTSPSPIPEREIARHAVLELFNLVRKVCRTEGFTEPGLTLCLQRVSRRSVLVQSIPVLRTHSRCIICHPADKGVPPLLYLAITRETRFHVETSTDGGGVASAKLLNTAADTSSPSSTRAQWHSVRHIPAFTSPFGIL
jgi:hypothetical protein